MALQQFSGTSISRQTASLVASAIETGRKMEDWQKQSWLELTTDSSECEKPTRKFSLIEKQASSLKETAASSLGRIDVHPCPVLLVEDDAGQREITLEYDCYTLGRDPQNDIRLRSQFVSRFHAVLRLTERADQTSVYRITDGDLHGNPSTNGILVNGQRQHTWDLKIGDSIIFGPSVRATYRIVVQELSRH